MTIQTVYRYKRDNGSVTVSPKRPADRACEETYRIIADEGKILTEGDIFAYVVDTDATDGWIEVEAPREEFKVKETV